MPRLLRTTEGTPPRGFLKMRKQQHRGMRARGFVLIELLVVVGLLALISAVAFPYLLPAIAFSDLEGTARHLSNYGRSAVAYAALMREEITLKVDLDKQEYWCVHFVNDGSGADLDMGDMDASNGPHKLFSDDMFGGSDKGKDSASGSATASAAAALEDQSLEMERSFEQFVRASLQARAKNAQKESILDEIGPLFDKEFTLDDEEDTEEEIVEPLLLRTGVRDGVQIEEVKLGSESHSKGVVDIGITSMGLTDPVVFYLVNESKRYFTVEWDPITGGTYVYEGKEEEESS